MSREQIPVLEKGFYDELVGSGWGGLQLFQLTMMGDAAVLADGRACRWCCRLKES